MPIENSTSLPFSSVMMNLYYIIPFITFLLGFLTNRYLQKSNNIRDKAKEITAFFNEKAKISCTNELQKITEKDFLIINYSEATDVLDIKLALNDSIILDEFVNSKLFKKDESEHLILSYTSNRHFNEYGNTIIKNVSDYSKNIKKLNVLFGNVTIKPIIPSSFRDAIRKNVRKTNPYSPETDKIDGILENGLFLIFVCCLFRSPNSFKSGPMLISKLLNSKSDELRRSIAFDEKSAKMFDDILQVRNEMTSNLQNLNKTISDLCEDFQNKYDI